MKYNFQLSVMSLKIFLKDLYFIWKDKKCSKFFKPKKKKKPCNKSRWSWDPSILGPVGQSSSYSCSPDPISIILPSPPCDSRAVKWFIHLSLRKVSSYFTVFWDTSYLPSYLFQKAFFPPKKLFLKTRFIPERIPLLITNLISAGKLPFFPLAWRRAESTSDNILDTAAWGLGIPCHLPLVNGIQLPNIPGFGVY